MDTFTYARMNNLTAILDVPAEIQPQEWHNKVLKWLSREVCKGKRIINFDTFLDAVAQKHDVDIPPECSEADLYFFVSRFSNAFGDDYEALVDYSMKDSLESALYFVHRKVGIQKAEDGFNEVPWINVTPAQELSCIHKLLWTELPVSGSFEYVFADKIHSVIVKKDFINGILEFHGLENGNVVVGRVLRTCDMPELICELAAFTKRISNT